MTRNSFSVVLWYFLMWFCSPFSERENHIFIYKCKDNWGEELCEDTLFKIFFQSYHSKPNSCVPSLWYFTLPVSLRYLHSKNAFPKSILKIDIHSQFLKKNPLRIFFLFQNIIMWVCFSDNVASRMIGPYKNN